MSVVASESSNLLERSALYREYSVERAEILKHKWLESEKAGRDIGFESALISWVVHHRVKWHLERERSKVNSTM